MEKIGSHFGRDVYYQTLSDSHSFPKIDNWICFAISNSAIDEEKFNQFSRNCISNNLLEFKAQGSCGENVHLSIDLVMVEMEVDEGHPTIDICTTGNNETDLANAFWECFFASALPERANYDCLKIVCVSIDGVDYRPELRFLIDKFDDNWIPEDD